MSLFFHEVDYVRDDRQSKMTTSIGIQTNTSLSSLHFPFALAWFFPPRRSDNDSAFPQSIYIRYVTIETNGLKGKKWPQSSQKSSSFTHQLSHLLKDRLMKQTCSNTHQSPHFSARLLSSASQLRFSASLRRVQLGFA